MNEEMKKKEYKEGLGRKLVLKKETIRELQGSELKFVVGGYDNTYTYTCESAKCGAGGGGGLTTQSK
jgi:hypothetical protein